MTITVNAQHLSDKLSLVTRAVSTRPSHPVLANLLLYTVDSELRIQGFDLSIGIDAGVEADCERDLRYAVPAALFSNIIGKLKGQITITCDEYYSVTITSSSGEYKIQCMDPTDYPELPQRPEAAHIELDRKSLMNALQLTTFAAATEETKQILAGVHFGLKNNTIELAATNGHRLSVVSNEIDADSEVTANIPSKALAELQRLLKVGGGDVVMMDLSEKHAEFTVGKSRLSTRVLEVQYPNYRQLIPTSFATQTIVNRLDFLEATDRIAIMADQRNNVIKYSIDNTAIRASVDAQDVGSAIETISANHSGEPLTVAFNVRYLLDFLKTVKSNDLLIQCNSPTSPVIFTPVSDAKMTYLVMPVRIHD